jgi:hypothetical protein
MQKEQLRLPYPKEHQPSKRGLPGRRLFSAGARPGRRNSLIDVRRDENSLASELLRMSLQEGKAQLPHTLLRTVSLA